MDEKEENKLDLALFLKSHSEEELLLLKNLVDKLLLQKIKEKEIVIPLEIFSINLNPAEAIVKYLKENKSLKLSEISKLLNKKENSIWLNYKRAEKSHPKKLSISIDEKNAIPISMFRINELSYLESIVFYLRHEKRLSNNEIALMLSKSPQVLSIAYNRAKSKIEGGAKTK